MPSTLRPQTVRQFLVTIGGVQAYFSKVSGIKENRDTQPYNDGQTGTVFTMPTFTSRENVTLAKPYYAESDAELVAWYKSQIAKTGVNGKFSVNIQPVDADRVHTAVGKAISLTGCEVISFKLPDVDREGNGLAMLEVEVLFDEWNLA